MIDGACDNATHGHAGKRAFPCIPHVIASGETICLSNHHCHPERSPALDIWGMVAIAEAIMTPTGGRLRSVS